MRLSALRPVLYAGKRYQPGESFDATTPEAKVLLALKWAVSAEPSALIPEPPAEVRVKRKYTRRDLTAQKPKRPYRRRDMTAES